MPIDQIVTPGVYRHFRNGRLYDVLGTGEHTEVPGTYFAVYRDPSGPRWKLYVRPLGMFAGTVLLNGRRVPRFERIETRNDDEYGGAA